MPVKVNAIDHLVINVTDVARSAEWYRKTLGMEVKVFDPGDGKAPRTSLVFGSQKINVRPRDADKVEWFTADHETAGSDDLCFHGKHAGRGGRTSESHGVAHRGRPGCQTRRPWHPALGLLPRPGWELDCDFAVCGGRGIANHAIARSQRVVRMRAR
jgi:catechol 2,3-dioxygenase-like lactoylglutathione lyase family enzyme